MSSAARKPVAPGPGTGQRTPSRPTTPSTPQNGPTRTRSVRTANGTPVSARAAVRKPAGPSKLGDDPTAAQDGADEDAKAEQSALIADLKEQLLKTESVSEEYQKQLMVLQSRLDEATRDQGKLEERVHEEEERVEGLENEKKELTRQRRELESIYEAERASAMKEKEQAQNREDDMAEVIQRLKQNLSQRDSQPGADDEARAGRNVLSRGNSSQNLENGHFAPPTSLQRSNSHNNSKILLQKDKMIESLRLDLAEAQIKIAEVENQGGGRMQELERVLLETRMQNARLLEDNESFQLLLSEKTLNGDFSKQFMQGRVSDEHPRSSLGPSNSLADELEGVEESDNEHQRRLEAEVHSLKDQNKALTLYINKIIERLLQHQGFESILNHNDEEGPLPPSRSAAAADTDKDLPPPPPKDSAAGQSFLQRARTVVIGNNNPAKPRPRPMSTMLPPSQPTANENPNTAPSVPLKRNPSVRMSQPPPPLHRHSNSELSAAAVVNNMYKGPSGEATSPTLISPRNSNIFAAAGTPNLGSRAVSGSSIPTTNSIAGGENTSPSDATPGANKAALDALNGALEQHVDTPSPPRSTASGDRSAAARESAVMVGNKPRPLRLVQENPEANKNAPNRASWFGWLGKGDRGQGMPNWGQDDVRAP